MDSYFIPRKTQRFELEIKRSRFVTTVSKVDNKNEAKLFIQLVRDEFPDANHHCWAMVAGAPDNSLLQDQSDDGEPKGTAGKPMLNVLQHSGLGNIVVVVTRYFGGIKLGAGGLVRGYTQCVSEALKSLETEEFIFREDIKVALPYSLLDTLEHWLKSTRIISIDKVFTEMVSLTLQVPVSEKEMLFKKLGELGQGSISYSST